jgi:hypothetical protein
VGPFLINPLTRGRAITLTFDQFKYASAFPTEAIASVRAARGPRALETSGQEELVSRFAAS